MPLRPRRGRGGGLFERRAGDARRSTCSAACS